MNEPIFENVDIFLPGQGDTLTQAPAYHWERTEERSEISAKEGLLERAWTADVPKDSADSVLHTAGLSANLYRSTRDPETVLVSIIGSNSEQRKKLARSTFIFDHTYLSHHDYDGFGLHLPGLIVLRSGSAVAVCQRRHGSMADQGHEADVLVSHSEDHGKTWSRQEVIYAEKGQFTFLGAIVEDRSSGTIFVTGWNMPAGIVWDLGFFSTYAAQGGGFWVIQSTDDGLTWSEARHVDPTPNPDGWVGWPNNSAHGIQLSDGSNGGRLVIPGFLYKEGEPGEVPGVRGGLLYSDDHGRTWTVGAVLPEGSDEVSLVETSDGEIYVSYRKNTRKTEGRTFARSRDGGESFYELGEHGELSSLAVHVGLARYVSSTNEDSEFLLFSHCVRSGGADMTIYASRDSGRTWPVSKLVDQRPCRYSDLAVTADGTVLCMYTVGEIEDREKITVARFNQEWLFAQPG